MILLSRLCNTHITTNCVVRLHAQKHTHTNIRCFHKQSRFRQLPTKPMNSTYLSRKPSALSSPQDELQLQVDIDALRHQKARECNDLQDSIISKLENLKVDLSSERYSDSHIFNNSRGYESYLSPSDAHILHVAKQKIPSDEYLQPVSMKSTVVRRKYCNDPTMTYRYKLVNNLHSIEEINTLIDFTKRLTSKNYINSKLAIQSFLKKRLIYSSEMHQILIHHKIISYMLIDYFMSTYKVSNLHAAQYIISVLGSWDTHSLNIYMKNVLRLELDELQTLRLIDGLLIKFASSNVPIDRVTFRFIYQSISVMKNREMNCLKLKNYLLTKFTEPNGRKRLIDQKVVAILFKEINNSLRIVSDIQYSDPNFAQLIRDDALNTMHHIPVTKSTSEQSTYINTNASPIKELKKTYAYSKFKTVPIFLELITSLMDGSCWKRAWVTIMSNHTYFNKFAGKEVNVELKKQIMKDIPKVKYSFYGKIFSNRKDVFLRTLNNSLATKLVSHQAQISNWQLLLRTLNEIEHINEVEGLNNDNLALAYEVALRKLAEIDMNSSHLDDTAFLLLAKVFLHRYLSTKLGSFRYVYDLAYKLQTKIDAIHNTSYAQDETYTALLKNKINPARCEYLSKDKLIDYASLFLKDVKSYNPDTVVIQEEDLETDIESNGVFLNDANTKINTLESTDSPACNGSRTDLVPFLMSPNLLQITPFEDLLFGKLSKLYVLDTPEKVENEYSDYCLYWDAAGIAKKDVLSNYHLGFIDKDYAYDKLKWERNGHLDDSLVLDPSTGELLGTNVITSKSVQAKIRQITDVVQTDLMGVVDGNNNHTVSTLLKTKTHPTGIFVVINPTNTLHNVLPNAWIGYIIDKCLKEWISERLIEK